MNCFILSSTSRIFITKLFIQLNPDMITPFELCWQSNQEMAVTTMYLEYIKLQSEEEEKTQKP